MQAVHLQQSKQIMAALCATLQQKYKGPAGIKGHNTDDVMTITVTTVFKVKSKIKMLVLRVATPQGTCG